MRNIGDAEELPSIETKGIRREIRPFALRDFLEVVRPGRFIHSDCEGLSIRINLDRLSDEHRREALEQLAEVMDRLRD